MSNPGCEPSGSSSVDFDVSYQNTASHASSPDGTHRSCLHQLFECMRKRLFLVDYTAIDGENNGNSLESRKALTPGIALAIFILLVGMSIEHARHNLFQKTRLTPRGLNNDIQEFIAHDNHLEHLRKFGSIMGVKQGAVATDHPACSKLGVTILRDLQGNAVDAAVAVALCLGVANPGSSGIGGGAFMLIQSKPFDKRNVSIAFNDKREGKAYVTEDGKTFEAIDCREWAPSGANATMFKGKGRSHLSVRGGLAVAIPGELRGLELAHQRHGGLPWRKLIDTVVRMAEKGVVVNTNFAAEIAVTATKRSTFGLRSLLTHNDDWSQPLEEGDIYRNERLNKLLRNISVFGSSALYSGEAAETLANDIQAAGGIVTHSDIENFRPTLRSPIIATDVNGFSVVGMPLPSSSGAVIIGALRFLSSFSIPFATFGDTLSQHRLVEACKHVFAMRMSMSDPVYNKDTNVRVVQDLIEGDFMKDLASAMNDNSTQPVSQYGGDWAQVRDDGWVKDASDAHEGDRKRKRQRRLSRKFGYLNDHGTSHFAIVDREGNAVSMTSSVNTYFGSHVVGSSGIILNNQMDDFATPGEPDYFGIPPAEANFIAPGKIPLSSMGPTMVFQKSSSSNSPFDRLLLVLGASGGPKIITAVLQVVLNHLFLGMHLWDAVVAPRIHDQLIYHGSTVTCTESWMSTADRTQSTAEIRVSNVTRRALERRSHSLLDIDYTGTVQAVAVDWETNSLTAVSDIRKGGAPDGY